MLESHAISLFQPRSGHRADLSTGAEGGEYVIVLRWQSGEVFVGQIRGSQDVTSASQ